MQAKDTNVCKYAPAILFLLQETIFVRYLSCELFVCNAKKSGFPERKANFHLLRNLYVVFIGHPYLINNCTLNCPTARLTAWWYYALVRSEKLTTLLHFLPSNEVWGSPRLQLLHSVRHPARWRNGILFVRQNDSPSVTWAFPNGRVTWFRGRNA